MDERGMTDMVGGGFAVGDITEERGLLERESSGSSIMIVAILIVIMIDGR